MKGTSNINQGRNSFFLRGHVIKLHPRFIVSVLFRTISTPSMMFLSPNLTKEASKRRWERIQRGQLELTTLGVHVWKASVEKQLCYLGLISIKPRPIQLFRDLFLRRRQEQRFVQFLVFDSCTVTHFASRLKVRWYPPTCLEE